MNRPKRTSIIKGSLHLNIRCDIPDPSFHGASHGTFYADTRQRLIISICLFISSSFPSRRAVVKKGKQDNIYTKLVRINHSNVIVRRRKS